jgi:cytochrome P450
LQFVVEALESMDPDDIVMALMETPQPEDPYPLYERLRTIAPRHPSIVGMRFLTRYDDCLECLRSPLIHMAFAEHMARADPRFDSSPWLQNAADLLIFSNPPRHTRIRAVLGRAFTPRRVEQLEAHIAELVAGYLDTCADQGQFDVVAELAGRLPSRVICELLGVPAEDQPLIARFTAHIAATVRIGIPDEALADIDGSIVEFHAYLAKLAAERRDEPRDDLISALVVAQQEEHRLDEAELLNFAVTLLAAGTETTANLLSVGTLALLQNPDQLARLRADPSLITSTVEELLRFESPVQMAFPRVATADTTIGGDEILEGEVIAPVIAAANHDPETFPEPGVLRVDRPLDRPSLVFGGGAHYCMGAALARLEGTIALKALLVDRFPGLELVEDGPSWRDAFTLRGLDRLLVSA